MANQQLVGGKYEVGRQLGHGSFGDVRLGINTITKEQVAIKLEPCNIENKQLPLEYRFYKLLGHPRGVPQMFYFGPYKQYNALVMELLGVSLEDVFDELKKTFSLKTIIQLAIQLIERMEFLHSKKILYRDVKPENFLVGNPTKEDKKKLIYIIDFGLAKEYIIDGQHIPYKEGKSMTGTARYMSINTHLEREQSRRDDLEALGYVFFYFLSDGKLPWQGIQTDTVVERYKKIGEMKQKTTIEELCQGHPREFGDYLRQVRALEFTETPDYARYKEMFRKCLRNRNFEEDEVYDWNE